MLGQLEVIHGPDKGRVFPLIEGQTLPIGRGPNTETRLSDRYVSRLHCQIKVENSRITLADQGGSGGTLLNSVTITEQELRHDDVITIGDTQLRVQLLNALDDRTVIRHTPPPTATPKLPSHVSELTSTTLAHYQIGNLIAKGRYSFVYQARDTVDNQTVALKVLLPEYTQF